MKKQLLAALIVAPLVVGVMTACAPQIKIDTSSTQAPAVPGVVGSSDTNNVTPTPEPTISIPGAGETSKPGAPDSGTKDPFKTLPVIPKNDPAYDLKTGMIDDAVQTRLGLVLTGDVNPITKDLSVDATTTGKTVIANEKADKPDLIVYELHVTDPKTTVKVTGKILSGYTIVVTNSATDWSISYNSKTATFTGK